MLSRTQVTRPRPRTQSHKAKAKAKDSGHKAKAKAKDSSHKAKAKAKNLNRLTKAKAKDLLCVFEDSQDQRPRPGLASLVIMQNFSWIINAMVNE